MKRQQWQVISDTNRETVLLTRLSVVAVHERARPVLIDRTLVLFADRGPSSWPPAHRKRPNKKRHKPLKSHYHPYLLFECSLRTLLQNRN